MRHKIGHPTVETLKFQTFLMNIIRNKGEKEKDTLILIPTLITYSITF